MPIFNLRVFFNMLIELLAKPLFFMGFGHRIFIEFKITNVFFNKFDF